MRCVTFSRNATLSLSRTCQCHCKYCAFKTHLPHLYSPDQVEQFLTRTARTKVKELLILTGEQPEVNDQVAELLHSYGHSDFTSYVTWVCEQALGHGLLPHTNIGVVDREDLTRLRTVTASQGLMLESTAERLMETVHAGSPTKHPQARIAMIRAAGELHIPFTTGILVGIGETHQERIEALQTIADLHSEYGHIQEVILQNFVPHRRYYGEEPADIASQAAQKFWETGIATGPQLPLPDWACPISIEEMRVLIRECRQLMPDVGVQLPPNLAAWWLQLIHEGATDLGGLSENGDHISPEHPFPSPNQVRQQLAEQDVVLSERLCVYQKYIDQHWLAPRVLRTVKQHYPTFTPRRTSSVPTGKTDLASALDQVERGKEVNEDHLTALFETQNADAIEEIRQAADQIRAEVAGETVTFVINRNLNISNVCTVGCAFCGFGKSKRSTEAYELDDADLASRIEAAVELGATEVCIQSGIHPDWQVDRYIDTLKVVRSVAPQLHIHAFSPMEIDHMTTIGAVGLPELFTQLIEAGLGSIPGTAAEVLDDDLRLRISPNKLPARRWIEIVKAAHHAGLPSSATVMFGHIETARELARHMIKIRDLQKETGGITEFVPLSFVPYNTRLGRSYGVQEISAQENLRHTAIFRIALGSYVRNLQASWVKMGLELATEALRWGVNDLGGTLMEESISRMAGADHGVYRKPEELIAAAHAAQRPAAQRTTLYQIKTAYPVETAVLS